MIMMVFTFIAYYYINTEYYISCQKHHTVVAFFFVIGLNFFFSIIYIYTKMIGDL